LFGGQPFAFALGNADRSLGVTVYPRYRVFPKQGSDSYKG
jgi:hypothetical protein